MSGILEMNLMHKNCRFLTVNREGDYKFEENRVSDENFSRKFSYLITPLKIFLLMIQIVVSNNEARFQVF